MADAPRRFDRAAERRQDLDFLEDRLEARESLLLPIWRGLSVIEPGPPPKLHLPSVGEARPWLQQAQELVFLGLLQDRACFAVALEAPTAPSAGGCATEALDLRLGAGELPAWEAEFAAYGRGLLLWHARTGHCSRCGQPTRPRQGGHMRLCTDDACGMEHYPRTDPAVLVLVRHGDRVLLGRQAGWPRGMYSALAGFVEAGESLEQAATREVLEESGVEIADLRYAGSQAWPYPASLMLGFTATAVDDRLAPGDDELEDVRWFSRAELRDPASTGIEAFFVPPDRALAGQLIAAFRAEEA